MCKSSVLVEDADIAENGHKFGFPSTPRRKHPKYLYFGSRHSRLTENVRQEKIIRIS
jgi:hypothetical protein